MDKNIDYGDLITSVIQAKASEAKTKRDAESAEAARKNNVRLEACRPLLTVMRQAKERFPKSSIFNIEEHGTPHFYTEGNTYINLEFEENPRRFTLHRYSVGRGYHSDEEIISSENAEDLIPTLVEKLAIAVTRNK